MMSAVGRERGQGILEFAVIFPIFILLTFAMIDGGLVVGRYQQVNHAASAGARTAATGAALPEIWAAVQNQSIDLLSPIGDSSKNCSPQSAGQICVRWYDGSNSAGEVGSYVKVTVNYRYKFITPLANGAFGVPALGPIDVSACTITRLERPAHVSGSAQSGTPKC